MWKYENILKSIYKLNDNDILIIFKIDIKSEDYSTTYVHYEIYEPYNFKRLNLSYCNESEIIIDIPVEIDSETISLYNSLQQYGYNLFDYNDSFYNDICTPYTTINNTDIILLDRKNIIYTNNGNKTICQNNCKLRQYNSTDKKASCGCSVQEEIKEPHLEDATFEFNKVTESFFKVLKNSNFLVLKCYKLVFNSKYILKNIGFFLMSIILLISIILILIFFLKRKIELTTSLNQF